MEVHAPRLHPGITQEVAPNESQRAPNPTTSDALIYDALFVLAQRCTTRRGRAKSLPPVSPDSGQADPQQAISRAQFGPEGRSLVHGKLLAEGEVLEGDRLALRGRVSVFLALAFPATCRFLARVESTECDNLGRWRGSAPATVSAA